MNPGPEFDVEGHAGRVAEALVSLLRQSRIERIDEATVSLACRRVECLPADRRRLVNAVNRHLVGLLGRRGAVS